MKVLRRPFSPTYCFSALTIDVTATRSPGRAESTISSSNLTSRYLGNCPGGRSSGLSWTRASWVFLNLHCSSNSSQAVFCLQLGHVGPGPLIRSPLCSSWTISRHFLQRKTALRIMGRTCVVLTTIPSTKASFFMSSAPIFRSALFSGRRRNRANIRPACSAYSGSSTRIWAVAAELA